MVIKKALYFFLIISNLQFLNAQSNPIKDIVKRDTVDIFSLKHKSSIMINDFKYKNERLTFIFSKKEFLKELKKASKNKRIDIFFHLEIDNKKFLKKIIQTNKEISFKDLNMPLSKQSVSFSDIEAIIERLLNRREVKIFFNETPIDIIYKIRIKRVGDQYSSTSVEYWSGDVFIIDKTESAVIE